MLGGGGGFRTEALPEAVLRLGEGGGRALGRKAETVMRAVRK
jgi:hypothetical protein